ncbi:SNARE-binding exocyst subunit S6 [Mycoblastus sanguinarius]|nr:SNARE-binding exocyst subunit S6 [Mycoblastus sanguinarius]
MADSDGVTVQLAELLRHPEDLDKIPFLKAEFIRKKAAVDGQLKVGLKEQLEITQSGMNSIGDGQRTVNQIKEELMKIDKLCAESQNMIRDFPNINLVSQVHRNFTQVETMKANIESFDSKLDELARLLSEDDANLENQPNLLNVHYGLTQVRDIRDDAMDQIRRASDASLENTLQNHFDRLDDVVNWFDEHIGQACMNLIPLVQADNQSMVVRLAVIIEEEEKSDKKVQALQDAQREYKDLASRFKSMNTSARQLRGYKEKFMKAIELSAQQNFDSAEQTFLEDPEKLSKIMGWYFNDLYAVKKGMVELMPKKWKIFRAYTDIYHSSMHNWLIKRIDDPELSPPHVLAIIDWTEKYYAKMAKLGWSQAELQLPVLDNREPELVREYRQLIVKSVDEWMDRMFVTDKKSFMERKQDSLDNDEHGYFRTKTLGDMWRMLREQTLVAGDSGRTDVAEGVIDAMFLALKSRQNSWQKMVDDESAKYTTPSSEQEGLQVLQDWLVAIANDQIACIDDNEDAGQLGYLTRFQADFQPLVSQAYMAHANAELEALRDGFVDLGTHCITTFVSLIFIIDFRTTILEFFTAKWYTEFGMKRIITTFEDYIGDYKDVLHHSLQDIFSEELADELLVRYLCSVRNKGAKFRRGDPFTEKFKDDLLTAFDFFGKFPDFASIKRKWRVVDYLVRMLEADKQAVVTIYEAFKREYWDVQMSWVESALRARDDYDRGMLSSVKAKASEVYVERGPETIMSKVK